MGAFLEAVTTWDASVITAIYENVHSAFLTMFFRIVTLLGEGGIFWIAVAVILPVSYTHLTLPTSAYV